MLDGSHGTFETFTLDWAHRQAPPPALISIASLQAWFEAQDDAMNRALSRFTQEELHIDRIDRGHGFIASPFVQHQIYREAVYIFRRQAERVPESAGTRRR